MKSSKSFLVLVPVIGSVTFVLSQWIINSNKINVFLGLSSDLVAGLIIGLGIGLMLTFLKKGFSNNERSL
ncbi:MULTISPECIES: hypothetical protein [unclassified Colwellia]|jgi:hypothetical protein|uniref:hypothetical protein n=1 Tax=unclassified Colwellia TaxID=196834 RepID=UPI0015F653F9|nr:MULTISPECIES: hypothetical protein [unclassified Colwellia]MBA6231066.1 hypothetical protein [Colwellia sp. MB02u-7]MBA6235831.1 hypothetical protein [Colwellia sp. MB02u-11]MBA6298780.1 hypothetical protein [Colwellia sp. MB3u-22]MBA6309799.1 hypothetical protein [Colwellia sp. MB3u-64]